MISPPQSRSGEEIQEHIHDIRILAEQMALTAEGVPGMNLTLSKARIARVCRALLASASEKQAHWVYDAAEKCRQAVNGMDASSGLKYETREHLTYMIDQIRDAGFSPTKACRWLGWVQACLYCNGTMPLLEAKEINREAANAANR